jgi:hypothetical protein
MLPRNRRSTWRARETHLRRLAKPFVGGVKGAAASLPKTRYAQFGRRKWRELGTDRTQMRCLLTDVGLSSGAGCLAKACVNKVRPQSDNACFDGRLQFSFVGSFTRRDDRTGDVAHPPLATQSPFPKQEIEQGDAAECPSPTPNAFAISRNSRSRTSISGEGLARSG